MLSKCEMQLKAPEKDSRLSIGLQYFILFYQISILFIYLFKSGLLYSISLILQLQLIHPIPTYILYPK